MPPLTLEGNTLGEKHKHFNKIVHNAIDNKQINLMKINSNDIDVENLLKIDVASKTRNVEYIIEVLKCNDMLYVSRAIKQSPWLITEPEYMHIINPEYLHEDLFPYMLTKAVNKLLLHIRLHLKDAIRVESFYIYIKDIGNNDDANKWLLGCSTPFIENIIQNEEHVPFQIYKRLCKRSIKFLKYYGKVNESYVLNRVLFLLKSNTEEFLKVLDVYATEHVFLRLNQKYTEIIMKKYPNRIIDNFETYINVTNLSVIAKYLRGEEIKDFLFKYMKNHKTKGHFQDYDNLKHFLAHMPEEDRFEFVKKIYIDKNLPAQASETIEVDPNAAEIPTCDVNTYRWYEYAPFNIAFVEIKKVIRAELSPTERCAMLSVLISCTRKLPQNINILLQHYYDRHRNEPFKFKIQFINHVIAQLPTHEFDSDNWNILDTLFHTLEVYIESNNDVQSCLQAIVLYKVLHDETVPDIVDKKLQFNTLKKLKYKLTEEQQTKLFIYLLNFIFSKIKSSTVTNESDLTNVISLIQNALCLIKDWNKNIENYPFIRNKIQELIKIKKENAWKTNFSSLYNVNKLYRKYMFQESIMLCPGEQVFLNALKHEPELLTLYSDVIDSLRADDAVSMPRLLAKLRIYWPHSLALEWTDKYIKQLDMNTGHRATVEGLVILLPQNQLLDIVKKYIPADPLIDWNNLDEVRFGLQKNIAKYLHKARPLIALDIVLWYAKGDYLQFSMPSLNAVAHNISKKQSADYIDKLIHSPVSLQKCGLRLAFIKLKYDELKPILSNIWKGTLNKTIRTHIFTHTYNRLCRVKDTTVAEEQWNVLSEFIENLYTDENRTIFLNLGNAKKVPQCVQGQFFMKSYQYLTSLPPAANCAGYVHNLLICAPNIMDLLDEDFVVNKLLSPIKEIISSRRYEVPDLMSSFVLFGKTEREQCKRFRRILVPALEHALRSWNTEDNANVYKENVDALLRSLLWNSRKFLYLKKIVVPIKLFTEIKFFLKKKLPIPENYVRYTSWTLTSEYVKLVAKHKNMFCDTKIDKIYHRTQLPRSAEHIWDAVHVKISPAMGSVIVKLLKDDTKRYFPSIYALFSAALTKFFDNLGFPNYLTALETFKYMIVDEEFIPCHLVVCKLLERYAFHEEIQKRKEIYEILSKHPSLEVQMHYHITKP